MGEFQAIYGVFINDANETLLFRRTAKRTYRPGELDLMGGEFQPGEKPKAAFVRESQEKIGITPQRYYPLTDPLEVLEGTDHGYRYLVLCRDSIGKISLDPKKHQGYDWYSPKRLKQAPLNPTVREAIEHIRVRRELANKIAGQLNLQGQPSDAYIDDLRTLAEAKIARTKRYTHHVARRDGLHLLQAWVLDDANHCPNLVSELSNVMEDDGHCNPLALRCALGRLKASEYGDVEDFLQGEHLTLAFDRLIDAL